MAAKKKKKKRSARRTRLAGSPKAHDKAAKKWLSDAKKGFKKVSSAVRKGDCVGAAEHFSEASFAHGAAFGNGEWSDAMRYGIGDEAFTGAEANAIDAFVNKCVITRNKRK